MVRHPQVVVRQVAHDLPGGFSQGFKAQNLAVPQPIGTLEETDAGLQLRDGPYDIARGVRHAVANNENFDILQGLRQRADDGMAYRRTVVMGGDEDGGLHG
jgi:hypothetical protein